MSTIAIEAIKIGKRHRRDLGDIDGLAASMNGPEGLMHPVVINQNNELVAGERRIAACRSLGWTEVPVRIIDLDQIVRGEFAENAHRKEFLPSEIAAIMREIEPLERLAARERMIAGKPSGNFPGGQTRDKVAAFAGISGRTLDKIKAVTEAAEKDPARFGRLVEEMDRTGKVDRYHSELRRAQLEETDAVPFTGNPDARIITGDYRIEGNAIEDDSVDLIFTDPPYHRKTIPQYGDLAKFAARALVNGGSLICYVGHYALFDVGALLQQYLRYHWAIAVVHTSGNRILTGKQVHVGWKPLLWFTKGTRRTKMVVGDRVIGEQGNKTLDHQWAQGEKEARYYINHLSRKNALIVDPYCGGGTTGVAALALGRRFVGFEIDADIARKAEARILRTYQAQGSADSEPPP
jgi:ParB-like chromosome segregation protein Spo0J